MISEADDAAKLGKADNKLGEAGAKVCETNIKVRKANTKVGGAETAISRSGTNASMGDDKAGRCATCAGAAVKDAGVLTGAVPRRHVMLEQRQQHPSFASVHCQVAFLSG